MNAPKLEVDERMGLIYGRFRGSRMNVVGGYCITGLVAGGGLILLFFTAQAVWSAGLQLPMHAEKGTSWLGVFFVMMADILLFMLAALFWSMTQVVQHRKVCVWQHGITIAERRKVREIFWDNIEQVNDVDVTEKLPFDDLLRLVLPRKRSKRMELQIRGETELCRFTRDTVSDLKEFAGLLHLSCRVREIRLTQRTEGQ